MTALVWLGVAVAGALAIPPLMGRWLDREETDVERALAELRYVTTCRCEPQWSERGRHHPTECRVEYRPDVETVERALRRRGVRTRGRS